MGHRPENSKPASAGRIAFARPIGLVPGASPRPDSPVLPAGQVRTAGQARFAAARLSRTDSVSGWPGGSAASQSPRVRRNRAMASVFRRAAW
jgi:hypothetical protein